MIQMGARIVSVYPDNGITWENHGGIVVFRGNCRFGGDSYISVGPLGKLDIGHHFAATAGLKLICYYNITFLPFVLFGWDCLCMDTNFHTLYDMEKNEFLPASGPIVIGEYNWFGTGCKVMHSVTTPERCIFGMGTTVTRNCVKKSYCVMGGSPVQILRENVMRDYEHDTEIIE
jgi:acetyltransferase-like isoleucine patch superfamily enzyme